MLRENPYNGVCLKTVVGNKVILLIESAITDGNTLLKNTYLKVKKFIEILINKKRECHNCKDVSIFFTNSNQQQ